MKYLGCVVLCLAACAGPRPPDPLLQHREPPPEVQECIQREAVQEYLTGVKQVILEQWEFPPSMAPNQTVDIIFSINESGQLLGYLVPDALTQEIEDSALEAIQAAAPFPPLSNGTGCLSNLPLRATFANPLRP